MVSRRLKPLDQPSTEARAQPGHKGWKIPWERTVKTGPYAQEGAQGCQPGHLEYEFPGKWVITQMVVHSQDGKSAITSFYVEPESESLEAANRFTLRGRQPVQYVILSAGIVSLR